MEREFIARYIKGRFQGMRTSQSRCNQKVLRKLVEVLDRSVHQKPSREHMEDSKHWKTSSEVLNACRIRLRRARGLVRPGAAGLLTGVGSSRIRDSA